MTDLIHRAPTLDEVWQAAERIKPYAVRTPILQSGFLNQQLGMQLLFKCENLQRGGAFKFRGACNAVYSLNDAEAKNGVVTQSSGNHGGAVALAARLRGIPAHIVVPNNAPKIKQAAITRNGAQLVLCEPTMASRDATMERIRVETGANPVHPFEDGRVMAGQGTWILEFIQDHGKPDVIMAPVAGGGLLAGTAITATGICPAVQIIGTEPAGGADTFASFQAGARQTDIAADTICDGLRANVGTNTFPVIQKLVSDVLTVTDEEIIAATRMLWENLKIVVEVSSAVNFAVAVKYRDRFAGNSVALIVTGGNVDLDKLPW